MMLPPICPLAKVVVPMPSIVPLRLANSYSASMLIVGMVVEQQVVLYADFIKNDGANMRLVLPLRKQKAVSGRQEELDWQN